MNQGTFTCVNCQLHFADEIHYKQHYKSEHHRYNVKRKLINLPPLSLNDYYIQFQAELSSKSQSNSEIYCDVCSKKFMSPQTYKQHINSQKHKNNRKQLLYHKDKSQSSSMSEFELIDEKKVHEICPFCPHSCTPDHLKRQHCFPPFKQECVNLEGLIALVREKVRKGQCIYCQQQFGCMDSAKQHMVDSGHAKLDIDSFDQFEPFYLWKICESSEEEEKELETAELRPSSSKQSKQFQVLHHKTLAEMEEERQARIKYGPTGVTINGKEVGYRVYRNYYKQYLTRQVEQAPRENHKALQYNDWKAATRSLRAKPQFQKISSCNNHR